MSKLASLFKIVFNFSNGISQNKCNTFLNKLNFVSLKNLNIKSTIKSLSNHVKKMINYKCPSSTYIPIKDTLVKIIHSTYNVIQIIKIITPFLLLVLLKM